jgi:energy-coupling factor transporter ATP-binding protein EcfA2
MTSARDNPFSSDRVLRERYRFNADDWARLIATLACHHGRGALVGQKGSGKTTLLEDLAVRLRRTGQEVTLIRLSAEFPRPPGAYNRAFFAGLTSRDAVLLDGAEQLSLLRWFQFRWRTRRAGFVVVTTHRARRLPLLHRCTTSPELLRSLVSSLGQSLTADESVALYQRHRGNLREALRELYDRQAKNNMPLLSFPALNA